MGLLVPVTVALNCWFSPLATEAVAGLTFTPVMFDTTVTLHVAVLLPSTVLTVIVADPAETGVTVPPCDTVATELLLVLHVTFWFVALAGTIVAERVSVLPIVIEVDVLFKDTLAGGITTLETVTVQVAVLLPSAVLTVITAEPGETAFTTPLVETVATAVLLLLQVTF